MTDFTSSINSSGLEAKYNPTSNLVSDLIPGAVASVVDFGASVWNSLPGTEEVATSDLLRNINQDALRVYQENPDTIHTASFIGGMFVPTGLALKGMKMARSGVKGVNWFSEAGRASDVAKVGEAFKTAGSASKAYREATRSMYAKSAVNNAIDAVAAEVALLSTMNAHPLMEDYMEDPGKNFAISLLGGTVLGAGIGHIADRFVLKGVTGKIAEEAFGTATSLERPVYPNMTSTLQLQSHSLNVKNMEAYMRDAAKAGKDVSNDEIVRVVDKFKTQNAVAKEQVFEALVSPEIRALPAPIKQTILQQIENTPEMAGVDAIRFISPSETKGVSALEPKVAELGSFPALTKFRKAKDAPPISPQAVKNNTFTGQAPSAGNMVGMTQPKGTPVDKLFSNFAYSKGDQTPGALGVFREKMFKRANADPAKFKMDAVETVTVPFEGSMQIRIDAASRGGTRVQVLKDGEAIAAARLNNGMLDSIAVLGSQKNKGIGEKLLKFIDDNSLGNIYEVPDRSPGFVNIQKRVITAQKSGKTPYQIGEMVSTKAVFFPNINGYAPTSAARHYAPAVSLVENKTEALAFVGKVSYKTPNADYGIELLGKSSAEIEATYVGKILQFEKLNEKDALKIHVASSDTAGLTAALSKARANPDQLPTVAVRGPAKYQTGKIRLHGSSSVVELSDDIDSFSVDNIFGMGFYTTDNVEVASGYMKKGKGTNPTLHRVDEKKPVNLYDAEQELTPELRGTLQKIAGEYDYEGTDSLIHNAKNLREWMNEFRAESSNFGLSKDEVQDIFAELRYSLEAQGFRGITHIGGVNKTPHNVNIYWHPKEDLNVAALPKEETIQVSVADLEQMIRSQKIQEIESLLAQGIPSASIAIRTNTPAPLVEAYIATANRTVGGFQELLEKAKDIPGLENIDFRTGNAIHSPQTAEAALDISKKPLVLSGNQRKLNTFTEAHAKMDDKRMRDISKQFISLSLAGSKSELAKEWGDWLNKYSVAIDIFEQKIGKVNNEFAGGRFVTSSDMYTRMMDELGTIANAMGKQSLKMSNSQIGRTVEPIRKAMETLSKDPAALLEFNVANNLLDSLKGWRGLQVDRKLVANQAGEMVEVPIMRIVQKEVKIGLDGKKIEVLTPVKYQGEEFVIRSSSVQQTLETMQEKGRELKALADVRARILGSSDINDIGFWKPTFNPVNKHIAYVHDKLTNKTTMLRSGSKESFTEMVSAYRKMLKDTGNTTTEVIEKGTEQKLWSLQNSRLDTIQMELADTSMLKKGSASAAIVPSGLNVLGELVGGYEHYILSQTRNLMDVSLPDIGHMLRRMSAVNVEGWEGMAKDTLTKQTRAPKDAAASIRNIMFGQNGLGEYEGWKTVNQSFENVLSVATRTVQTIWESATGPMKMGMFGMKKELSPDKLAKLDYEKFAKDLEAKGIVNPYKVFDDEAAKMFGLSKLEDSPDISKRLVYGGNAFAATLALRVGELAQPLVNIMSMPILTHLASAQKMPEHFLGRKLATANVSPVQIMYEGMRHMNSPMSKNLAKEWEKAGYFDAMISEANDTLQKIRSFDKDAIATAEKALNSNFIRIMSKPADWSEAFSRKYMMHTGAVLAKRLYPELDDAGVTLFARDFMDKTIGNFHAPQRPVFFQGTLGVALGLFQTYSLTLAQNMYRHLEMKNYKALGKAALTQSTIFGIGSLPGFRPISDAIGEEFSDDHTDLTTGTFRAASTPIAESILYGLPSQVGVGTHTRGDSNFRFPGAEGIVAVNFAKQVTGAVMSMANAVGNADKTVPQAFLEAMSLQNISRPLARGAELASGYSVTRNGNTVQTPEEVWTMGGVAARVLATRPIEEIKLRDAMHLNQFYGSVDYENRQSLMSALKTKLRAGTLSDEDIAKASNEYLRKGGTPTGWRSAYRTLLATEDYTGKEVLANKLRMDSPLNYMIDSLDGY